MPRSTYTSPDDGDRTDLYPDEFVADLDDKFLDCRLFGHAWTSDRVKYELKNSKHPGAFAREARCSRCKLLRLDFFNPNKHLPFTRRYYYPSGYIFHSEHGPLKRPAVEDGYRHRSKPQAATEMMEEIAAKRTAWEAARRRAKVRAKVGQ